MSDTTAPAVPTPQELTDVYNKLSPEQRMKCKEETHLANAWLTNLIQEPDARKITWMAAAKKLLGAS